MSDDLRKALDGPSLAALRRAKRVKAVDLARALDISPEWLSRLENGHGPVSLVMSIAIRATLATPVSSPPASSPPVITEEMVERGARSLFYDGEPQGFSEDFSTASHSKRLYWLRRSRACLTAALASPEEGGEVG